MHGNSRAGKKGLCEQTNIRVHATVYGHTLIKQQYFESQIQPLRWEIMLSFKITKITIACATPCPNPAPKEDPHLPQAKPTCRRPANTILCHGRPLVGASGGIWGNFGCPQYLDVMSDCEAQVTRPDMTICELKLTSRTSRSPCIGRQPRGPDSAVHTGEGRAQVPARWGQQLWARDPR